ncbi:MAG: NAD(P)H-binding protein, partial [Anaerolineae bacterium]|nr:NAD(P)H-binding protein [Anaerolineae bacterium]
RRLCDAVRANRPAQSTKYVLMSTTGYRNSTIDDPLPFTQKLIVGLLRLVLPPHADNEQAAGYLVNKVGRNDKLIEWAAVRPDNLIDEDEVTPYDVYPSPLRSAIFGSGQTSRINVGHFMADLITEDDIWQQWQGQLPVIYNRDA